MLESIIQELESAEASFRSQVEKLFGKIESTDFSDEYKTIQDAIDKLKAYAAQQPQADQPTPEVTEG